MRYVSQFEIAKNEFTEKQFEGLFDYHKHKSGVDLGKMLVDKIGVGELVSYDPERRRFETELEAFSMKEWIEFKKRIREWIEVSNKLYSGVRVLDLIMVGKLFKSLEDGTLLNNEQEDNRSVATKMPS